MNAKTVKITAPTLAPTLQEATIVDAGQDTILVLTYELAKVTYR